MRSHDFSFPQNFSVVCRQLLLLTVGLVVVNGLPAAADGPQDNIPAQVRPVPPAGIDVPAADRAELQKSLDQLAKKLETLKQNSAVFVALYIPDIEIFHRAVDQALQHQEFYSPKEIANARQQLHEGLHRADALLTTGKAPWAEQTGFVVRGFRSKIDQTVQPYGVEIPAGYQIHGNDLWRCDLWFHGRGEKVSETAFIQQRKSQKSKYDPQQTIVLHPYGRYSNAFKFAGEIDVLEALAHARQHYRIDEDRVSVRGFSMGGAGCWQMAVHYPDRFFAANPGAGFCETKLFLNVFQNEQVQPTWWEQKLWGMYDCPAYARNFHQLNVIAYSGEIDKQKQAADVMEAALKNVGIKLPHIIGPQTGHQIHPESAKIVDAQMDQWAQTGRNKVPPRIQFETRTLRYSQSHWLQLTGLKEHWEPTLIDARLDIPASTIHIAQQNVTGLELKFATLDYPFSPGSNIQLQISTAATGEKPQVVKLQPALQHGVWTMAVYLDNGCWVIGNVEGDSLQKLPGLQGPIDDAFLDSFLIVRPTGTAFHSQVGEWSVSECDRFVREWRRHFRGDAQVINDVELTAELAAGHHLILFGDPGSNQVLAQLLPQLPLQWTPQQLTMGNQSYSSADHAPVLIYPNPQHPDRYVVLNSGFTFREYAYLNNARQVPMLPDWGVIDLSVPPNTVWPGKVVDANFFNEQWKWK